MSEAACTNALGRPAKPALHAMAHPLNALRRGKHRAEHVARLLRPVRVVGGVGLPDVHGRRTGVEPRGLTVPALRHTPDAGSPEDAVAQRTMQHGAPGTAEKAPLHLFGGDALVDRLRTGDAHRRPA